MKKIQNLILNNYRVISILWFVASIVPSIINYFRGFNNYLIFKGVFWHTIYQLPLYIQYPEEYSDSNHYGVFFSAIIAPFAVLPDFLGSLLWNIANALILYFAIRSLRLSKSLIIIILWISLHELYGASDMQQFNTGIAALIVLSFVFVISEKDRWASWCIAIGLFTKIYGIVGLAFFFFSKKKKEFIIAGIIASVVCFLFPMLYSSPEYVIAQYCDWFYSITEKNSQNLHALLQNISFVGFLTKTGLYNGSTIWVVGCGALLFLLPYLRFSQYKNIIFQYQFLASALLFLVLFSTGSESSTYIIAYVGIGIWYTTTPNPYKLLKNSLLILAIIASFSGTDLVPKSIKYTYVVPYALRAIPSFLIWITLIFEMCLLDYRKKSSIFIAEIKS